jgi:hypothetical protein
MDYLFLQKRSKVVSSPEKFKTVTDSFDVSVTVFFDQCKQARSATVQLFRQIAQGVVVHHKLL